MISTPELTDDPFERSHLLLVGSGAQASALQAELADRYPDWAIERCDSYLAAIGEVSRRPARTVLGWVDAEVSQLGNAVAGLREAIGDEAKLLLCCTPETEPLARDAVTSGADEYLIYPLDGDALDAAMGLADSRCAVDPRLTVAPAASMEEFVRLGETLACLADEPRDLLNRIVALAATALSAGDVTLVVEGAVAHTGRIRRDPVLSAPLLRGGRTIGHLSIGERTDGAYTPGDVEKLAHYATVVGHILEAASKQRTWRRLSVTDECSGLPNRRYVKQKLEEILTRAAAEKFPVTLLLFDIDDFKTFNDTCGHAAGDEILRVTGQLFRKHCREQDIVARYGGDEFLVLFWDAEGPRVAGSHHPDCALAVLERVREALQAQEFSFVDPTCDRRLTISGGLATYPWDASTGGALIERADAALLAAKRAGKNRIFLIGDADGPPR